MHLHYSDGVFLVGSHGWVRLRSVEGNNSCTWHTPTIAFARSEKGRFYDYTTTYIHVPSPKDVSLS